MIIMIIINTSFNIVNIDRSNNTALVSLVNFTQKCIFLRKSRNHTMTIKTTLETCLFMYIQHKYHVYKRYVEGVILWDY